MAEGTISGDRQPEQVAAVEPGYAETYARRVESLALWAFLIFGVAAIVLLWVVNADRESIPIIPDRGSVGFQGVVVSMLAALILTPIAYLRAGTYRNAMLPEQAQKKYRWLVIPITLAVTLLVGLVSAGSFEILTRSFEGVELSRLSASLRLGAMIGTLSYLIVSWVARMRGSNLIYIAVFYLFATLLVAGATNENAAWYEGSFSYLGMTESSSNTIFNLGLPFTGILIVIWSLFFTDYLDVLLAEGILTERSRNVIRWAIILAGILLSMVGIVRFGIGLLGNIIHDLSATGMGVMLGLLMLLIPRYIKQFPREFYIYSYAVVAMLVLAVVLFITGVYSLTGIELSAFSMSAIWLIIFYRNVVQLTEQVRPDLKF